MKESAASGGMNGNLPTQGEAILALVYLACYLGWLFYQLENELAHWLTLVLLPLGLLWLYQRRRVPGLRFRHTLASVGLARGNLKRGALRGCGPWSLPRCCLASIT